FITVTIQKPQLIIINSQGAGITDPNRNRAISVIFLVGGNRRGATQILEKIHTRKPPQINAQTMLFVNRLSNIQRNPAKAVDGLTPDGVSKLQHAPQFAAGDLGSNQRTLAVLFDIDIPPGRIADTLLHRQGT